jgi:NADH-quinone oxidoreductase subunit F
MRMPRLNRLEELIFLQEKIREEQRERSRSRPRILVGMGTCGIAAGAKEIERAIRSELARLRLEADVESVGCIGMCAHEPLVDILVHPLPRITYADVTPEKIPRILEAMANGVIVREWAMARFDTPSDASEMEPNLPLDAERETSDANSPWASLPRYKDLPFFSKQRRVVLRHCGIIDPERIEGYLALGGYQALAKALRDLTPAEIRDEVKRSGLRGRGGGGFATGQKWEFTAQAPGNVKYIICNADEGDPGAFMDRSVLEGDPHSVLEGMAICGYAVGASEGYIYCRAEYPLAIQRLKSAIRQAEECGLLGEDIFGSGFSFRLHIKEGAGAFVCGEETALIASIEGRRGEPRPRPPFPARNGLWNRPTNVNNLKSYANVAPILNRGADWFRSIGTEGSPGTAVFALTGKVANTGLIEVPMGITLGEIIFDIGGGVPGGKRFKAVQTGGPLGGCLPAQSLNVKVDFDSLREAGAVMGSGGMIVVDEDTCMVEFARFFLTFAQAESCGKCVPCRVGGQRMLEVLDRISEGRGRLADLDALRELASGMKSGSLCGLGQLTPGPVMSALRYFEDEFKAHILDQKCAAGSCRTLTRARCVNACPVGVDVPSYVALVAQGRYAEALEIHRERNPFALVCGRVCRSFCEKRCRRADIDQPLDIQHIKRFMADHEIDKPWTPPRLGEPKGKKVAIIGSGPAGLTAALRLAQRGYEATVFEKLPVAGGMMAVGIPEFRLPRHILNLEIENIRRAGVEIKLTQELGRDFTLDSLSASGYGATVLAIGAHRNRPLGIPGEELPGVMHGTAFLRDVAQGNAPKMSGLRVVVVGGGPVALDTARTALRLGASEVRVVYRRTRDEMPAWADEIRTALEEGVQLHTLTNPTRVIGTGHVTGLECQRQRLVSFDDSARRRPEPIPGSEFVLHADVAIPAIGQATELDWLKDGEIGVNRDSTLNVSAKLATAREGVFACGDATLGPATVAEAVAEGNLVAVAVDAYLQGQKIDRPRFVTPYRETPQFFDLDEYVDARRAKMPELSVEERIRSFAEVESGFDEKTAREECKRCLRCDLEWLERMRRESDEERAEAALRR